MKKPTWVSLIGILGIVFSCMGLIAGLQQIFAPRMLDYQRAIFEQIETEIESGKGEIGEEPASFFRMLRNIFNYPEWFPAWCVGAGIAKLFICGWYLYGSILLLTMNPGAFFVIPTAASASVIWAAANVVAFINAFPFFGIFFSIGLVIGAVIDIVIMIIMWKSDHSAFYPPTPPPVPG